MDKIQFGKLIAALRQTKELSQKDFAEVVKVSPAAVSKWERGVNFPDIESLEILSEYFEIPLADFFSPEETLKRLRGGLRKETPSPADSAQKEAQAAESMQMETPSSDPAAKKPRHGWKFYTAIAATVLLVACLIGGGIYYYIQKNTISAVCIAERAEEDENYGVAFDFAIFYTGNFLEDPNQSKRLDNYCKLSIESAIESQRVPYNVKIFRFYFYRDKDDALNWAETNETIFYLH